MSSTQPPASARRITLWTAIAIVVANMVGTGVFTSLGFQLFGLTDWVTIVTLWLVGGLIAICGALTYAELATHLPASGGEYQYLSRLWHPGLGFISAWVSATVGFSAPTALAAIAMAKYLQILIPGLSVQLVASAVVLGLTILHSISLQVGSRFQIYFTIGKVLMMVLIIGLAIVFAPGATPTLGLHEVLGQIGSNNFATSLVYVSYAYSGWNAATYLAGEIQNPRRNIPIALLGGTAIVMVLYAAINYSFMAMAPIQALAGKLEVGTAAITHLFGLNFGLWMSAVIALLLVSTISAMTFAGPRLLAALGQDVKGLGWLARRNSHGLPWVASLMQLGIALLFIWTGTFDQVLVFSGGLLCLFTMITTLSVFRLRFTLKRGTLDVPKEVLTGHHFKTWAYPLPPLIFLALNAYMLVHLGLERPLVVMGSIGLVVLGMTVYVLTAGRKKITI